MRRLLPHAVLALLVVAILVVAAISGTGHDSQYVQALDAEWHSLHASEREQGCWLISYVGVEQAASTMSWELGLDQDHAVIMLNRHCPIEDQAGSRPVRLAPGESCSGAAGQYLITTIGDGAEPAQRPDFAEQYASHYEVRMTDHGLIAWEISGLLPLPDGWQLGDKHRAGAVKGRGACAPSIPGAGNRTLDSRPAAELREPSLPGGEEA